MVHPLLQAADLVEAYVETLNDAKSVCECCGLTKYENWPESQQKVELDAVVRKLRRYAATAERSMK